MDIPIATIFMFDWITDVMESVAELPVLVVVVLRDVRDKFLAEESDTNIVVGSNPIKIELIAIYSILDIDPYMHMTLYDFLLKFR